VSGGTVEIFLEPRRPAPRLLVVGASPVAQALAVLGPPLGYAVETGMGVAGCDDAAAVVVASHGRGEEPALEAAVRAGVPYVGLVASRARAQAVLGQLDVDTSAVHSPAGLDIGGRTAAEIALAVLAEIVATRRRPDTRSRGDEDAADPTAVPVTSAVDPVCGMTVAVSAATPRAEVDGVLHSFCCEPCRVAYLADPQRYATV